MKFDTISAGIIAIIFIFYIFKSIADITLRVTFYSMFGLSIWRVAIERPINSILILKANLTLMAEVQASKLYKLHKFHSPYAFNSKIKF